MLAQDQAGAGTALVLGSHHGGSAGAACGRSGATLEPPDWRWLSGPCFRAIPARSPAS